MTLPIGERQKVHAIVMRRWSELRKTCPVDKNQLLQVVNALDDWWINTGRASANQAIPQPMRGLLDEEHKMWMFAFIIREHLLDLD